MTRTHIIALTIGALMALCAVTATPALAADEWLANGAAISAALPAEVGMELTLVNLIAAGGATLEEILCSLILQGTVGPIATDLITDMLSLTREIVGELGTLNEKFLNCEVVANNGNTAACQLHTLVELWVDNLSLELSLAWPSEIELMAVAPTFLDHIFGNGVGKETGYEIKCEVVGGFVIEELCEGLTSAALENVVGGVTITFNWEVPTSSQFTTCSLLGAETGGLKGAGTMKLVGGELLSVS